MITKKFSKKLTLNKKTVANLNVKAMKEVHGGISDIPECHATYGRTSCGTECYSEGFPLCHWQCV